MVYIYQSHLGGLYVTAEPQPYDWLYCDECGDSDVLVLSTDSLDEVAGYLRGEANLFGSGGYDVCYLNSVYRECRAILEGQAGEWR